MPKNKTHSGASKRFRVTGSGKIRRQKAGMLTRTPPIYVVCPGRVFRTDEYDATHSPMFHQVEGLVVDEGITMAHLKGSLDHFAQATFGAGITTRFRPSYFPFTEPSAEMDLRCWVCHGESVGNPDRPCRTCSSEGWIEWGGCGISFVAGRPKRTPAADRSAAMSLQKGMTYIAGGGFPLRIAARTSSSFCRPL